MTQAKIPDRERVRDTSSQNRDIAALTEQIEELGNELETGLDDLCEFFYKAQKAKSEQQTNIVLLSLILLCLIWLNVIGPMIKQAGGIAQMPGQALQSVKNSLSAIKNKIPFLPKSKTTATGSLKISGYWSGQSSRGDRFAGGKFTAGSPFGPRSSPGGIGSTNHRGQDVPAPSGTPLYAVGMKGEQVQISCGYNAAGGNQAKLSAPSYALLGITLGAAHMVEPCRSGAYQAGQMFGRVGSTGHSTGAHLHLGFKINGEFQPPQRWAISAMLSGKTLEGMR